MKTFRVVGVIVGVAGLMLASGCGPSGKKFQALDITMQASPALTQPSGGMKTVEVNVVGVPASDVAMACGANPGRWFSQASSTESTLRAQLEARGLVKRMTFKTGNPTMQMLGASDPFWKVVKAEGIRDLLIIADPPIGEGGDGALWRRCIKAETETWVADRVTVTVGDGVAAAALLPPK